MNDDTRDTAKKSVGADSIDGGFALGLGTLIGIGAGLGITLGSLLGDLAAGLLYGVGTGVVCSVLEMSRRPSDQPNLIPLAARPPSLHRLMVCLSFLCVSAVFGGFVLVGSPSGAGLRIPLSVLRYSPFTDFLLPGLMLGIIFGIGSFFTVMALQLRPAWPTATTLTQRTGAHWAWSAAVALGVGQIIWIVTQILMVRGIDGLQVLYGSLGVLIVVLAFQPDVRRYFALDRASTPS